MKTFPMNILEVYACGSAHAISDGVIFTGPLYGKDNLGAYTDADVYVLPSVYEAFPVGLLKAYACGKPVVASKVGSLQDLIVDGVTGFLVEVGNVKQLFACVRSLLDDSCRAESMGLQGKRFVKENFSIETVADKVQDLYNESRRMGFVNNREQIEPENSFGANS